MDLISNEIKNHKDILILGFGIEGQSTFRFIRKILPNQIITIADKSERINKNKLLIDDPFVRYKLGEKYLHDLSQFDLIVKTPGISLKNHREISERKCLTSQTDLFLKYFHRQTIGITGTKGKSTVTSLIYHLLTKYFDDTFLVGNIGIAPFDILQNITKKTMIIYELSCHQLEFLHRSPFISILLNIYEEHLDFYSSYEQYQQTKFQIFKYQNDNDTMIYNVDNKIISNFILNFKKSRNKIPLSIDTKIENGFKIENDKIYKIENNSSTLFYDGTNRTNLIGDHNLFNMMSAIAVLNLLSISNERLNEYLNEFQDLPHRLEFIGNYKQINFYDDSISTIVQSTIEALKTLRTVDTLILGGFDRGINYKDLFDFLDNYSIGNLIFVGNLGERLFNEIKTTSNLKRIQIHRAKDYSNVVDIAFQVTKPNQICLLSPAAPSFDLFENYQQRGEIFRRLIQQKSLQ